MNEYLLSLINHREGILEELYKTAQERSVPIIREDMEAFLRFLIKTTKPKRILEAGTAIGYSSILMAQTSNECVIDTVEIDPECVLEARKNISRCNLSDRIHVILGDMQDVFSCLNTQYDLIFLDGAKSRYIDVYDDVVRLLKINGILVCDNIIFYGKIYNEPRKAHHKHRTIVTNMRNFLERLTSDDRFESCILETGDGVTVSCRVK